MINKNHYSFYAESWLLNQWLMSSFFSRLMTKEHNLSTLTIPVAPRTTFQLACTLRWLGYYPNKTTPAMLAAKLSRLLRWPTRGLALCHWRPRLSKHMAVMHHSGQTKPICSRNVWPVILRGAVWGHSKDSQFPWQGTRKCIRDHTDWLARSAVWVIPWVSKQNFWLSVACNADQAIKW